MDLLFCIVCGEEGAAPPALKRRPKLRRVAALGSVSGTPEPFHCFWTSDADGEDISSTSPSVDDDWGLRALNLDGERERPLKRGPMLRWLRAERSVAGASGTFLGVSEGEDMGMVSPAVGGTCILDERECAEPRPIKRRPRLPLRCFIVGRSVSATA